MTKQPLLSIIMPAYNVAAYIQQAIDAVLTQSHENFELIIINDGSTDDTLSIIKYMSTLDPRIVIINKENGGLSDARNCGLEVAKGDYVHFYDSDDIIAPDIYNQTIPLLMEHDGDVVIFGYNKHFQTTNTSTSNSPNGGVYEPSIDNCNSNIIVKNEAFLNFAWNKVYSRKSLSEFRFKRGLKLIEDIEFNSRFLVKCSKIIFLPTPLYNYIIRESETLSKFYSIETVSLCVERQRLLRNYYNGFQYPDSLTHKKLAIQALNDYQYCFAMIYGYSSFSNHEDYYNEVLRVLNNRDLRKNLSHKSITDPKSLFLYISIKLRLGSVIDLLYRRLID